ncbi:MAG: DUF3892 domain-containing protein [Rhizomicrobium sp.]
MAEYKITFIRLSNPKGGHSSITHFYGPKLEDAERMYVDNVPRICEYIEAGRHRFYMEDRGLRIYVKVRAGADGVKYLQACADGEWTNDLLDLPERGMDKYQIHTTRRSQSNGSHESITHLAGPDVVKGKVDYYYPIETIISFIETEKYVYYMEKSGERLYVDVRAGANGRKIIQTRVNGDWTDDLLSLPPCPGG